MMSNERLFAEAGLRVFERGWLSSNNILFADRRDAPTLLVDTGYATHALQTIELIRGALGGRRLDTIVNTHLHSDHCGGNAALAQVYGCGIVVPIGEADKVDRWDEEALTFRATGQQCPRFVREGVVRDGERIRCGDLMWQAIAAPGHDPESIVLYQPDVGVLISADALWQNGFGVVFPELEGSSAFDDVRATLDRIADLPVKCVIPGHGSPFTDVNAAIERAHRRLDAFVADPRKHAQHAAKVLIKFHMLEVQVQALDKLTGWLHATAYLRLVHRRYFNGQGLDAWTDELMASLAASGAVSISNGIVRNI